MINDVATTENLQLPVLANRIQQLEEQIQLIDMRLKMQPTIPRFGFVVKIGDEQVWTALDLLSQFPAISERHPDDEITISWRSSPAVWI